MVISQGLLTRRSFIAGSTLALGSLSLGSRALGAVSPLTGADVVRRIKEHLDMEWDQASYRDTLKAGDLALSVKGVAVCFMSTLNVLQRANAQGLTLSLATSLHSGATLILRSLLHPIISTRRRSTSSRRTK